MRGNLMTAENAVEQLAAKIYPTIQPQGFRWPCSFVSFASLLNVEFGIRTTMMKNYARTTKIWSAETCLHFDRLADLSARQSLVQRFGVFPRADPFDGDKSPAQSADRSAHSEARWLRLRRAGFISVHPWFSTPKSPKN
jgi:hypothetical protein